MTGLLIMAAAVSCDNVEEPSAESGSMPGAAPTVPGTEVSFKFTIYADDRPSRSRALGVWEESAANVAERILDAKDLRVLVFNQAGVLLKSVRPSSLEYTGVANDGFYSLNVAVSHEYFDKFDDDATVPFSVMILANLQAIGGNYRTYEVGMARIADIKEDFRMSASWFPSESGGIPMFGLGHFLMPKADMLLGHDAPEAGEINMLRSLCKIEVNDRIANAAPAADGLSYPRVVGVEMISWADNGYLRPRFDDYAQGLKFANIHPAAISSQSVEAVIIDDTYRFYCPEAEMKDMKFRVAALHGPGQQPQYYEIDLGKFSSEIGSALVRNHIYRFDVHALNTMADLRIEVSDWNVQQDDYELDNVVSVESDGFLKWSFDPQNFAVSTEKYNGTDEQQLSILNATTAYATGIFHLASPRGATWKAYFIPGENGVDAFEFIDVDAEGKPVAGSQRVYAEGLVGQSSTIHIRGKGPADSYRHWAELVVEVHTLDGTILHAPLTPAMSSRYIVYRENKL